MIDQTLSALVFIGLVFGGVVAASVLVRAVLLVGGVIRALAKAGEPAPFARPFETSRIA